MLMSDGVFEGWSREKVGAEGSTIAKDAFALHQAGRLPLCEVAAFVSKELRWREKARSAYRTAHIIKSLGAITDLAT
jgi:hypothetical protein